MLDDLDALRAQRVARLVALCLEHQKSSLELAGQRLGQDALVMMGADASQRLCVAVKGPVCIGALCCQAHETGVVLGQVAGQPRVGRVFKAITVKIEPLRH